MPSILPAVCAESVIPQLGLLEDGADVQGDHHQQEEVHGLQVQQVLTGRWGGNILCNGWLGCGWFMVGLVANILQQF